MQRYDISYPDGMKEFENGDYVLYTDAQARIAELEAALRVAYENLNGWCEAVDNKGTGWDDWDEYFKAAYYGVSEVRYSDGSGHDAKPAVLKVIRQALSPK